MGGYNTEFNCEGSECGAFQHKLTQLNSRETGNGDREYCTVTVTLIKTGNLFRFFYFCFSILQLQYMSGQMPGYKRKCNVSMNSSF